MVDERRIMTVLQGLVACLSLAGEIFVIFCFYLLPKAQSSKKKLILGLTISNFVATIGDLLFFQNSYEYVCILEGFLRSFGELSSVIWVSVISYASYREIMDPVRDIGFLYKKFIKISIFFPLIVASIPLIGNLTDFYEGYNHDKEAKLVWCSSDNTLVIVNHYPFIFVALVVMTRHYYKIHQQIKRLGITPEMRKLLKIKMLFVYPGILLLSWLPGIFDRTLIELGYRIFPVICLHIVGVRSQGFTNALFYVYSNRDMIQRIIDSDSETVHTQTDDSDEPSLMIELQSIRSDYDMRGTYRERPFDIDMIEERRNTQELRQALIA